MAKFILKATGKPPTPEQQRKIDADVALAAEDAMLIRDLCMYRKVNGWGDRIEKGTTRRLRNKLLCLIEHDRILNKKA